MGTTATKIIPTEMLFFFMVGAFQVLYYALAKTHPGTAMLLMHCQWVSITDHLCSIHWNFFYTVLIVSPLPHDCKMHWQTTVPQ